jgi:hypothetical protein
VYNNKTENYRHHCGSLHIKLKGRVIMVGAVERRAEVDVPVLIYRGCLVLQIEQLKSITLEAQRKIESNLEPKEENYRHHCGSLHIKLKGHSHQR